MSVIFYQQDENDPRQTPLFPRSPSKASGSKSQTFVVLHVDLRLVSTATALQVNLPTPDPGEAPGKRQDVVLKVRRSVSSVSGGRTL